jgi:tellurite resistance protein TehA-like permease
MATGIVSLAAQGARLPAVAFPLFWLNVLLFAVLAVALIARCVAAPDRVTADMHDHRLAPGFFTAVAGACVLGNQCVLMYDSPAPALGLGLIGLLLWAILSYRMLPGLMETETKPALADALNGGWLLIVVATQALSVLASLLATEQPEAVAAGPVLFVALAFWLVGGMLYVWIIALIFYRCMFLPLSPGALTPPYWINMGAMAISTLSGVRLIAQADRLHTLEEILPFLKGLTLMFWATASWWIPMLVALGIWRHILRGYPLRYDHGYWAAVFPLGMYTVCTQQLMRTLRLPFLEPIPAVFVWVALASWAVTFVAMVFHLRRGARTA